MLHELNPYTPGSGLAPPALVGRDAELASFDQLIIRSKREPATVGRPLMLSGYRGVGKTTLLNRLRAMADQHEWLTIALEAQTTQGGRASVRTSLGRELTAAIRRFSARQKAVALADGLLDVVGNFSISIAGVEVSRADRAASGSLEVDVQELIEDVTGAVASRHRGFAIFIDELQDLDPELLAALISAQHASQQRTAPFYLIGAGLPSLPATLTASRSYAERLFNYRLIGPLDDHAARAALTRPAEATGAGFTPAALDLLIGASDGYPYFLQEYGAAIWDLSSAKLFTEDEAQEAVVVGQAQLDAGFYPGRWDRATPAERRYMEAMAVLTDYEPATRAIAEHLGASQSSLSTIRDELIKKGLIYVPERGRVAFPVPGMGDYIKRQQDSIDPERSQPRRARRS